MEAQPQAWQPVVAAGEEKATRGGTQVRRRRTVGDGKVASRGYTVKSDSWL